LKYKAILDGTAVASISINRMSIPIRITFEKASINPAMNWLARSNIFEGLKSPDIASESRPIFSTPHALNIDFIEACELSALAE